MFFKDVLLSWDSPYLMVLRRTAEPGEKGEPRVTRAPKGEEEWPK